MYGIFILSFVSAWSDNFFYVTCTTAFPLGGPDSCIIWANPPSYSPGDQGTTVLNLGAKKRFCLLRETKFL